jgi:hypothetical protein
MSLSFPYGADGVSAGATFTDRGCVRCPSGYTYTADQALNVLERVTNNILLEGWKDYQRPNFPLASEPIQPARYEQMSINTRIKYHAFFENPERSRFYDPMPSVQTFQVTRELIDRCGGNLAMAQMIGNANSLGCAPPRGRRGVSGKDRYYSSAATTVVELGPFCVTDYQDLWDFAGQLEAMKKAAIEHAGMALEYEKIRRYVEMSWNNASAVAGTTRPRFFKGRVGEFPNSPGSFDWIFNAVDTGLGTELSGNEVVTVKCSQRLIQYWIELYKKQHNLQVWADSANVRSDTLGYIISMTTGGEFTLLSLRTNRQIKFSPLNVMPVYLQMWKSGISTGSWDFQPFYVTEPGDDPEQNQANGFRQRKNPDYGDPAAWCDGVDKMLAEPIFVYTEKAFHYEAFPTNPLGKQIEGVEGNLNVLWGSTDIMWHFGTEVQEYYLNPLLKSYQDAGVDVPCWNNRDRTWFAGVVKAGCQFVEDDPRQMMTLFCSVPSTDAPLQKSDSLLPCSPGPVYNIQPVIPSDAPDLCNALPDGATDDPDPVPGTLFPPAKLHYLLPSQGANESAFIDVYRNGGSDGSLTLNYAFQNVTAHQGTEFLFTNGSVVFADGETKKTISFTKKPTVRTVGQHFYREFLINWSAGAGVIDPTAVTQTPVCLALACAQANEGDCPDPSCANCPPYDSPVYA